MTTPHPVGEELMQRRSRRRFLHDAAGLGLAATGLGALAGCAVPSLPIGPAIGEGRPETSRLRLVQYPSLCFAPQYVATDLFQAEGFTSVEYVHAQSGPEIYDTLSSGAADITMGLGGSFILRVDQGDPIVLLST